MYRGRIDMERCLETNIVCSNRNKLCKDCKLDECKETIKMIDRLEEKEYDFKGYFDPDCDHPDRGRTFRSGL